MSTAIRLSSCIVAALALAPASALANPKGEAKQHIEQATVHHKALRFREALEELQAAYKLDPKPDLLYAIGQMHVKLGRCSEAIGYYERYLATKPPPGPASATKQAIQICKTNPPAAVEPAPDTAPEPKPAPVVEAKSKAEPKPKVEPKPAFVPAAEPKPAPAAEPKLAPAQPLPEPTIAPARKPAPAFTEPRQPPPPPVTVTGQKPWYTDKLGLALTGAGLVSGVVGALLYSSARGDVDASDGAVSYAASQQLVDDAKGKRMYAAIAGTGGLVLASVGVVHLLFAKRGTEERAIAIIPAHSGAAVTWSGRF